MLAIKIKVILKRIKKIVIVVIKLLIKLYITKLISKTNKAYIILELVLLFTSKAIFVSKDYIFITLISSFYCSLSSSYYKDI